MKAMNLCLLAGICAGIAPMAAGQSMRAHDLVSAAPQRIEPVRVRRVAMQDGNLVYLSDWMEYAGRDSRATNVRIFDCYGDEDADGIPNTGGLACGLDADEERYAFGASYCNMFVTNDFTVAADTVIGDGASEVDYAWYWNPNGDGSDGAETCVIGVFTQESTPCDADTHDYGGWLIDYGSTPVTTGNWYSATYLGPDAFTLPSNGTGSYMIYFLSEVTTSGGWVLATCAQPLLWGTGDAGGAPDNRGAQGVNQLDDDVDFDGEHGANECDDYSNPDGCPSVLGAMAQFWGNTSDDACLGQFPNCNADDTVNTQDFLCFLGKWSTAFQTGNYDAAADCNGDNTINTQDFLCFLQTFSSCFG